MNTAQLIAQGEKASQVVLWGQLSRTLIFCGISRQMAIPVVDLFEVIDIVHSEVAECNSVVATALPPRSSHPVLSCPGTHQLRVSWRP